MTTARAARRRSPFWALLCAVVVGAVIVVGSADADDDVAPVVGAAASPTATLAVTGDATDDASQAGDPTATGDTGPTPAAAQPGTALDAVADLTVKGRAPKTGYSRDQFGAAWADVDHNGCDTRNDILARDLVDVVTKPGTDGCVVLSGTLHDPFSGETVAFQRGASTSSRVQIDHVVALSDAWQKGAQQWAPETRRRLGNDPLNLLAVSGSLNQQKGDGDAATWLPPHKAFRCAYVARQVAVKQAYGLWVTQAEHDAMVRVLTSCPDEPLSTGGLAPG